MKKCISLLILIFFQNCEFHKQKTYNILDIFTMDTYPSKSIKFDLRGGIDYSVDSAENGGIFGNRYEFYSSGILKRYSFEIDSSKTTYSISFDSVGLVDTKSGTPLVYTFVSADDAPDSLHVKYHISNFALKTFSFFLSDSSGDFQELHFKNDNEHAFLKTSEYWKNIKNVRRVYLLSKYTGEYEDGEQFEYFDTIDVTRRH